MAKLPASIRSKNPGAMWPGPISKKWGSTRFEALNDGTGQGNKIAYFDTYLQGICAQLDLWRSSANYRNKRLYDALYVWSGKNNVQAYLNYVIQRIPQMTADTVMNDAFWASPLGVKFLKVQAGHEAGRTYPAPEADWAEAQRIVVSGKVPMTPATKKVVATTAATNTVTLPTGAATAADGSLPWWAVVIVIALGVAIPVLAAWWFNRQKEVPNDGALEILPRDPVMAPGREGHP